MGKPGGFFKKLKAKHARVASKQRRGTKGSSKEERVRKHNEKVEYYAARREAEDLAAISSSSDSEASTDSEVQANQRDRKLHKLQRLLGMRTAPAGRSSRKRARGGGAASVDGSGDDGPAAETVSDSGSDDAGGDNGSEQDGEDWEALLPGSSSSSSNDGDEEEEEDGDRLDNAELLMDEASTDPSDDDADGEDGDNPFYGMDDDDDDPHRSDGELDSGERGRDGDLYAAEAATGDDDDDEEVEEEEEEEEEDSFVDDDADGTSDGKQNAEADAHVLLPQFKLGTTSLATLQASRVLTSAEDPWYRKYHQDALTEIDRSTLAPVALPPTAHEALRTTNAAREARAAAHEKAVGATAARKDVQFVSAEEYRQLQPDNVSVAATAVAREYLQCSPPYAAAAAAASPSPLLGTRDMRPSFMHEGLWAKWISFRAAAGGAPSARAAHGTAMNEDGTFRNTAGVVLTTEERGFFDLLQGYADVMDCVRCWQNADSRREVMTLHALNHLFKARAVVMAHDKMLSARKERRRAQRQQQQQERRQSAKALVGGGESSGGSKRVKRSKAGAAPTRISDEAAREAEVEEDDDDEEEEDLELRDRGFGKTRVLVMLPMRNQAYQYVHTIVRLLGADPADCPGLATFQQDFTEIDEAIDPTFKRRPRDYQRQFAGNIDDSFCVGLRVEPNRVRVYAHPLNSDLIICSPLGLRRRLERNGDILVSLSSIEVCIVDAAHVLLEQNWGQVSAVMGMLNKRPTDTTHGLSDLRRVYAWALDGKSGRHRQTIYSSDISNATMLSAFRSGVNTFGKLIQQHRKEEGVLARVQLPVRQHFTRFVPSSLESVDEDRFQFFTTSVYTTKIHPLVDRDVRTIIVVPSYFDFVRVRNYLYREYRESLAAISEYSSAKQQRRALGQFTDLERPLLLMTERFYFFKRYFVKLAEVLVFYSPPLFPDFYCSLVNRLVATSPNAFVLTVFCAYDTHELNRLVGTARMLTMLERESGVFSFLTS